MTDKEKMEIRQRCRRITEYCTAQDAIGCRNCIIKDFCRMIRKKVWIRTPANWSHITADEITNYIENSHVC